MPSHIARRSHSTCWCICELDATRSSQQSRRPQQLAQKLFFSSPLVFGLRDTALSVPSFPLEAGTAAGWLLFFLCHPSATASKTSLIFVLSFTEARKSFSFNSAAKPSACSLVTVAVERRSILFCTITIGTPGQWSSTFAFHFF